MMAPSDADARSRASRCADALAAARAATSEDDAARAIEACAAIAIERGDANESELVEVAREALEFRGDASTSTRLAVARACETLGRGREEFLALALEVARDMTRDERGAVARRACASAGALFREALIVSAVKGNAVRVVKAVSNAWSEANVTMEGVRALGVVEGVHEGTRMACAKTMESAILALAGEGWGSNVVKPGHKTLNLETMMSESVALSEGLHEMLRNVGERAKPTGPLALVLVAALGNLSVKKAELATGCMPVLMTYAKAHVAREKAEIEAKERSSSSTASVSKELKSVLLDVLRNGPRQAVEGGMMNEISTVCRELGAGEAVDSALRHRERTAHASGEKRSNFLTPTGGGFKRARLREQVPPPPPPIVAAPMTEPGILHQIRVTLATLVGRADRSMLDAFVTQLAPPALADAILANLSHLPPASQYYLAGRGANAPRPPPPPPISTMINVPEAPEEPAEPLSVVVKVEELDAEVAEAFRLEAIQRMLAVGSAAEEYGGGEKLTLAGSLRSSLLARLAASGAAKSAGASLEEETNAIASALLFTAEGGGVYETEGVNMLMKWLTTLYAQEVAFEFSYVPYDQAISAAIDCLTRGVAGATSTTAMASGAKKPLSQLLCDVPALPGVVWRAIRVMCRLEEGDEMTQYPTNEETVVLVLGVLQDLILERPPARDEALEVCLACATHEDEDVRGKAIRLIANRLHPVKHLTERIEAYARDGLGRGRELGDKALEEAKALAESEASVKEERDAEGVPEDVDADAEEPKEDEQRVEEEVEEEPVDHIARAGDVAVGSMLLYCALCARNLKLLPGLFEAYARLQPELQVALHRPVNGLARAVGPNCLELCEIIASPPEGSLTLAVQCLNTLASIAAVPAPATLLNAAEALSSSQNGDVRYLAPLVCSFDEERVRNLLPQFIHASSDVFASFLDTLLSVPEEEATLTPAAIFIAVHEVQVGQAGVTLKQLVDACSVCFDRPDVFTPQVLATSLQQMVEFTPLPLLFMRTVIQAETIAPQLREFTLGLLRTLVNRQVWKMDQKIWEGYLRCLKRAAPQSYPLMVELPAPVLGEVLDKFPALRDGLKTFATRSSVPKAIAAILNASN